MQHLMNDDAFMYDIPHDYEFYLTFLIHTQLLRKYVVGMYRVTTHTTDAFPCLCMTNDDEFMRDMHSSCICVS